jgi:hypothetical protein
MICPDCNGQTIEVHWNEIPSKVGYCPKCDMTLILDGDDQIVCKVKEDGTRDLDQHANIPELKLGTLVYINNKEHEFFLELGEVIEKDHEYYRVKFRSLDKRIERKCLWVPSHWVEPLPKQLIRGQSDA